MSSLVTPPIVELVVETPATACRRHDRKLHVELALAEKENDFFQVELQEALKTASSNTCR